MDDFSSNVILQVASMHPKGARVKQGVKKLAYLSSNVTFASASDGAGDKARCAEVLGTIHTWDNTLQLNIKLEFIDSRPIRH